MNYIFLYASTIFCGAFFLGKKRRVDFLLIYFISLFSFSLSVYFGVVYDPFGRSFVAAQYETSVIYGLAYLGLLIVGMVNDFGFEKYYLMQSSKGVEGGLSRGGATLFMSLLLSLSLVLFVKLLPIYLSASYKKQALEQVGFSLMLMSSCVVLGFGLSLVFKSRFFTALFSLLLLMLFVWGTRSPAVFALFVYIIIRFGNKKVVAANKIKMLSILLFFGFVAVVGKNFYGEVIYSDISVDVWLHQYSLDKMLAGMEFLYTPAILDKVVEKNFSIDFYSVLGSFFSLLPFPSSLTGYSPSSFNDAFQPILFPGIEYGMAFNPWAEAYSWMKWGGVIVYSIFIPYLMALLNLAAHKNREKAFSALFLVVGVMLAFWIHRNSLGSIFAYIRNAVYPFLGIYAVCFFADLVFLRRFTLKGGF